MTTKLAEWASEHDQIIKSGLSCGHQEKFLPSAAGLTTIGFDLKVIWEISVKTCWSERSMPLRIREEIQEMLFAVNFGRNAIPPSDVGMLDHERVD